MQDIFSSTTAQAFVPLSIDEIRARRQKRIVVAMLTVYGDESSDAKGVRTFAVAGILGTQDEWDTLKSAWVETTKGKIFHATDCESGYGQYNGIPRDKRLKEYRDLTKLLAGTNLIGIGSAIDIQGYKAFMPDAHENGPYFHCFSKVIMACAQVAYFHIPKQTVKFIFDINYRVRYNAAFLYENYLTNLKGWEYGSSLEDELRFAINKTAEIQVADLLAHETMKYLDNQLTSTQRRVRESLRTLMDTRRFKWFLLTKRYCQGFKKQWDSLEAEMGGAGSMRKPYEQWLQKNNRQDNCENKTQYLIELECNKNP